MVHIQAGVDHGDLHSGAGIAQLLRPNGGNAHHLAAGGGQRSDITGASLNRLIHRRQENALDAIQSSDLLQIPEFRLDGEGVGQVCELISDLQLFTAQNVVLYGSNHSILLLEHLLLRERGNLANRSVGVRQSSVFHHNKRRDPLTGFQLLCRLTQLLHACRSSGLLQRWGRILLQGSSNPGAALCFGIGRFQRIGLQGLWRYGLDFLRRGSRGFSALCRLPSCHAVRTCGRCVNRRRQDAENHADYQEH